ncbi:unannotated protein [freshwater metagenome]|uniref:Unannotated protein n=2 Tax=freshwater metagenome TaxID=449393 RepID=A0A6J7TAJ7_9ZZZZ
MERPNTTTAIKILVPVSNVPVTVKFPNNHLKCPSINTQVSTPSVATNERALRITALIGRIIEPVKMKMSIKTLNAIQPSAQGRVRAIPSCASVKSAAGPPMRVPAGAGISRNAWIITSAAGVRDGIDWIAEMRRSAPFICVGII